MKILEKMPVDFEHIDTRGRLTQLVHEGYSQINVLFTKAGVERGGHYHKRSIECFYVVHGAVQVTASKDGEKEVVTFFENDFFKVSPYVVHSMFFPEDCTLVAMYDKCVELDNGSKDIYPA